MKPVPVNKILYGDALSVLKTLPGECVDCILTSPPYWGLRDYGILGQIGHEKTPEEYTEKLVSLFSECKRTLKKTGILWLNLGDSYAANNKGGSQGKNGARADRRFTASVQPKRGPGLKPKDLCGIPWRVAFALQTDGWYLRQDIIWSKPNPRPESVTDRCTRSHEYIFMLTKSSRYFYDADAIKEPAVYGGSEERIKRQKEENKSSPTTLKNGIRKRDKRAGEGRFEYNGKYDGSIDLPTRQKAFVVINEMRNKRSVWNVTTKPFKEAHFATFPEDLISPMVLAGCPVGGVCLDPFMGAGTTAVVAKKLGRNYLGIELNPQYIKMAEKRIAGTTAPLFSI